MVKNSEVVKPGTWFLKIGPVRSCHMAIVAIIINERGLGIDMRCRSQPVNLL